MKTAETVGIIFGFRTFWLSLFAFCMVGFEVIEPVQSLTEAQVLHFPNEGDHIIGTLEDAASKSGEMYPNRTEGLALAYVSNSTVLRFFSDLGVNLDPFFKLLWRHVLTVEILSAHFQRTQGQQEETNLLTWLLRMFSGASRKDRELSDAIKYLEEWGKTFWENTEFRVKEITQKVVESLTKEAAAKLGSAKLGGIEARRASTVDVTDEQKAELVVRGQNVISEAQVHDLHRVPKLIDPVLGDRQQRYYIVIDGLDENWVDERLRYRLIMALIVTARDFGVKQVKVILALRRDLIERVFRLTRDSGFQEEKYQSSYLPLVWSKDELLALLDARLQALVRRRYTSQKVSHTDILPKIFGGKEIGEYVGETAPRPRDVIAFFNSCIGTATDAGKLAPSQLKLAEGEYSRSRLRALGDEWSAEFPSLLDFAKILYQKPPSFKLSLIPEAEAEELCLNEAIQNPERQDFLTQYALKVVDMGASAHDFLILLIQVFYRVGLVGLKLQPYEAESWVDAYGRQISGAEITAGISVVVHPSYRRALGVRESKNATVSS